MKQTIDFHNFYQAFIDCGRKDQFSYEAFKILFDNFERYEEDTGVEIELDVIAICCEYSEDTPEYIAENYSIDISECEDDEAIMETVEEYLEYEGVLVGVTNAGTIVYQQY